VKITAYISIVLIAFSLGYILALKSAMRSSISSESINSKVIPRSETERENGNWGVMDKYTYDHTSTYGTENMFTALVDLVPGESVHPAHHHAEEEIMLITKGSGIWSLGDKQIEAKSGDLLYASPWKMHGLENTGTDTMTFFFLRWLNKGVALPAEPEADNG